MYSIDETKITVKGLTFKVSIKADNDNPPPWDGHDGHGPVRRIDKRYRTYRHETGKRPGERPMGDGYFYDWQAAMKQAKGEGWGPATEGLTRGQQLQVAVQQDFDYLKAWVAGDFVWCGVCVTLEIDGDAIDVPGAIDSLWGVEFWQHYSLTHSKNAYALEIAQDMALDLANAHLEEQKERQHWAERDVVTV